MNEIMKKVLDCLDIETLIRSKNAWNDYFWIDASLKIAPRPLLSKEGVGDRLRSAAFAEVQAGFAFYWAIENFISAPEALRKEWLRIAKEEEKHLLWLLKRADELSVDLKERPVSDGLVRSLLACSSYQEFLTYMADAEERGRRAGERFGEDLVSYDSASAQIFSQIALEERTHIGVKDLYL
jgi:uncharacterized ferritin-like protein (DUF455 family)